MGLEAIVLGRGQEKACLQVVVFMLGKQNAWILRLHGYCMLQLAPNAWLPQGWLLMSNAAG